MRRTTGPKPVVFPVLVLLALSIAAGLSSPASTADAQPQMGSGVNDGVAAAGQPGMPAPMPQLLRAEPLAPSMARDETHGRASVSTTAAPAAVDRSLVPPVKS